MRTILFFAANAGVMFAISILVSILQATGVLPSGSAHLVQIGLMSLVFGFAGSIISLFMSKSMAKRSMGVQIITQPSNPTEQWLIDTVAKQSKEAGISMPEVGVFNNPTMNAFATGASKNKSLVAVSTGLLQGMEKNEVEAVLAHEVCHAANGDMVTMALLQGVLNTFVIFIAQLLTGWIRGRGRGRGGGMSMLGHLIYPILQMGLGFLTSIIASWFSRQREFRADSGAAKLTRAQDMVAALERLQSKEPPQMPASMAAFGIFGKSKLFSTHPPLEARIAALLK